MRNGFRIPLAVVLAGSLTAFSAEAQTSFSGVWTSRPLAKTPAGEPGPRGWVDLIHDPVVGRPVLFGGSGGLYMNDILQIDLAGSRWIEIEPHTPNADVTPDGPPCGRDEQAVEYDPVNRLYWSFGGSGYACNTYTSVVAAGSGPTQIVDLSLTATTVDFYLDWLVTILSTTPSYSYVSAYDPTTKTLTLRSAFSGDPTGLTYSVRTQSGGGTWFYNPATREWRGFDVPSFGYVGARPMSRLSPAFAYSTGDHAAVMFGGDIYNDTWALDVEARTWVAMRGDGWAGNPPRRAEVHNSMVYDSVNQVFVLFGGQCGNGSGCGDVPYNGLLGDTWIYRLATNTWTEMTPGTSPPARMQHTLTYDTANGVAVLFGGRASNGAQNDVWVYDVPSNIWTQVSTGSAPATRRLHAMVYDPNAGEHIIFGGNDASGATLDDVWSLRLTRTGPLNPLPVRGSVAVSSAPLVGTKMVLKRKPGPRVSTTTDAAGVYRFDAVAAGVYNITIEPVVVPVTSTVSGTLGVRDVPSVGTKVRLKNLTTGIKATTTTDATGAFSFPGVVAGTYRLRIPTVRVP